MDSQKNETTKKNQTTGGGPILETPLPNEKEKSGDTSDSKPFHAPGDTV